MHVFTHETDQQITIGSPADPRNMIQVMVVEIRDGMVRIGIKAPVHVTVDRKEIWMEKQEEKRAQKTQSALPSSSPTPEPASGA